jgi:FixJ family two-component response regulator
MNQPRQTVFIIDDDKSVRKALRRLIRSVGFQVEAFATAEEFLQAPAHPAPGCLILDVDLPGLSGLELHQQLIAEGRGVPIVFITAFANGQMRETALRSGAVAFLEKPFEERSLLGAIEQAIGLAENGGDN